VPDSPPLVGIIMGSRSDMPVMEKAAALLAELGVPAETRVMSAHRTPGLVADYARTAGDRGLRVIIAAAGGAAHLAGAVAAQTLLPVIGVPIATQVAGGLDSLLSTVQMPRGVPVATMAIGGAENAALLAAEILALDDPDLRRRLAAYRERQAQAILDDETNAGAGR
jgi:phosphoribosylaminoimidazole carboxylase PurE protein